MPHRGGSYVGPRQLDHHSDSRCTRARHEHQQWKGGLHLQRCGRTQRTGLGSAPHLHQPDAALACRSTLMHLMKSIVLVPVLALAAATTVFAQTGAQGREAVPEDYGYLIGHGGVTAAPAGAEFAVEYGEHITRNVQAYITLSYFENLMDQTLRDDFTTLGASLSTLTGDLWALDARDRGVSLVAGGKY